MTVVENPDSMRDVTRVGDLYAFYEPLLTERQRQIVELYHFEDMSLGEIAEILSISRQAVHDQLRRVEDQLESYEAALHLRELARAERKAWEQMLSAWQEAAVYVPEEVKRRMDEAMRAMGATLSILLGGDADVRKPVE